MLVLVRHVYEASPKLILYMHVNNAHFTMPHNVLTKVFVVLKLHPVTPGIPSLDDPVTAA